MQSCELGVSGLEVSALCLGTMTYGNPVAEADAIRLTHWALDHGINFIDTANMYEGYDRVVGSAGGVAEDILGQALAGKRDQVVLATKAGSAVGPGPEDQGLGRTHLMREIEKSLQRMKTDYVDLYYLHRPDPDTPIVESLAVLNELVDVGKIRHYGFSNYDAAGVEEMLAVCDAQGLRRPVVNQPPYSLLKRDAEADLLPLCKRENIAVVPYQVLQGGLLTGKYRRDQAPPSDSRMTEKKEWLGDVPDATFDELESIERRADARGLSMTQYAIKWALEQPGIASAIIGVKREKQLAQAVAAVE